MIWEQKPSSFEFISIAVKSGATGSAVLRSPLAFPLYIIDYQGWYLSLQVMVSCNLMWKKKKKKECLNSWNDENPLSSSLWITNK